jgi:hypothetical protein
MDPREARPGTRVRVTTNPRTSGLEDGMRGVVTQRWGHPDYPALDVRLENGRSELFWFHELDEVKEPLSA